jgi:hypothetical protein
MFIAHCVTTVKLQRSGMWKSGGFLLQRRLRGR